MSEITAIAEKAAEEIYGHVNTDGFGGIDFERKEIVKIIEEASRAAIEAYEAAKRVEPIETAPKDGTPILAVYGDGYGIRAYSVRAWSRGNWSNASEGWADEYRQLRVEQPTHWMKLPNLDEVKP